MLIRVDEFHSVPMDGNQAFPKLTQQNVMRLMQAEITFLRDKLNGEFDDGDLANEPNEGFIPKKIKNKDDFNVAVRELNPFDALLTRVVLRPCRTQVVLTFFDGKNYNYELDLPMQGHFGALLGRLINLKKQLEDPNSTLTLLQISKTLKGLGYIFHAHSSDGSARTKQEFIEEIERIVANISDLIFGPLDSKAV